MQLRRTSFSNLGFPDAANSIVKDYDLNLAI